MTGKILKLAAMLLAFSTLASAAGIMFGLAGDPNQNYLFTRTDTPVPGTEYPRPGMSVTVSASPYPGWEGQNITADDGYFFCISFTLTATFANSYSGVLFAPTRQGELEDAYLSTEVDVNGGQNASLALKDAISMAIWQLNNPKPGDVPRDPAAQQ